MLFPLVRIDDDVGGGVAVVVDDDCFAPRRPCPSNTSLHSGMNAWKCWPNEKQAERALVVIGCMVCWCVDVDEAAIDESGYRVLTTMTPTISHCATSIPLCAPDSKSSNNNKRSSKSIIGEFCMGLYVYTQQQ